MRLMTEATRNVLVEMNERLDSTQEPLLAVTLNILLAATCTDEGEQRLWLTLRKHGQEMLDYTRQELARGDTHEDRL